MEFEIHQLLNQSGSAQLVADELIDRWKKNLFSPEQQSEVAGFLLASGQLPKLLGEIERLLKENRQLPWGVFAQALIDARVPLLEADIKAILDGVKEQNAFADLLSCREAEKWHADLSQQREILVKQAAKKLADRREQLRERLQFFRTNRMYQEEAAAIAELRAVFPEDPEFQVDEKDLALRWARDVIAQHQTIQTDLTAELSQKLRELPVEMRSLKDLLHSQALARAQKDASAAYDLALMFSLMEFFSEALEILQHAPPSPQADWLRLELMIKARDYLSALEEANRLEIVYAGDPESTFAVIYSRARALWGLGQSALAIDLMQSLVNVRPNYKSASSLLADWSGGQT